MTTDPVLKMPPAIRDWLVDVVEQAWPDPAPVVAAIPTQLPAGAVRSLARGGPFGLLLDGRLDEIDGRIALEVLEDNRMSGESYLRVWDDGSVETLEPAPRLAFSYGPDDGSEERKAAEAAFDAHNRRAYAVLRERGFRLS